MKNQTVIVDHSETFAANNVITLAKLDRLFRLSIFRSRIIEYIGDSMRPSIGVVDYLINHSRMVADDLASAKSLMYFWALGTELEDNDAEVEAAAYAIIELLTPCETPLESRSDYAFDMADATQLLKQITGF
jgi:hypothetical protein